MNRLIIDVREPQEYAISHVEGAINIPPDRFVSDELPELADVPKSARIVVYCRTGSRSKVAMQLLAEKGFTNVKNGINQDQVRAKYLG